LTGTLTRRPDIVCQVECDDRFPWGFEVAFSSLTHDLSAGDYFFITCTHYVMWERKRQKIIYDALRLYCQVRSLSRGVPKGVGTRAFRSALTLATAGASAVLAHLFAQGQPRSYFWPFRTSSRWRYWSFGSTSNFPNTRRRRSQTVPLFSHSFSRRKLSLGHEALHIRP